MKVTLEDEFINCKYSEIRYIVGGSFGQVFLAKDKNTNSNVAIKYISFDGFDESERDKLLLEGQILFKITNKNIISFENFFYNKSRAILIMEYAEGGDLDKKIKAQMLVGPFKEEKIISWFLEICEAIKYLHQRHIIHRDLKPLNIFLTIDNNIKLGDFGLSKVLNSSKELIKSNVGTLIYMSPEIIKDDYYSFSSDIWSLGIILFELCLLKNPLIHLNELSIIKQYILYGDFEELINQKKIRNIYSERTCDLIKKILVKNPVDRPTIDTIIQECKGILYDFKSKKKHLHTNQALNTICTHQNKEIENNTFIIDSKEENEINLKEAITKIINDGYQIFNNKIQFNPNKIKFRESLYIYDNEEKNEKNTDKNFEKKNGNVLYEKDTPKITQKSDNKNSIIEWGASNRPAPPVYQ